MNLRGWDPKLLCQPITKPIILQLPSLVPNPTSKTCHFLGLHALFIAKPEIDGLTAKLRSSYWWRPNIPLWLLNFYLIWYAKTVVYNILSIASPLFFVSRVEHVWELNCYVVWSVYYCAPQLILSSTDMKLLDIKSLALSILGKSDCIYEFTVHFFYQRTVLTDL